MGASPGPLLCPGHPGTRLSPYPCQNIPQVRGWGWCCVRCWGPGVPLPRALPSRHLGDPHRAVAAHAAPPECRCLGLGSTGAAESIAPLRVPLRALCLSPPNCHHELPSTLASTREQWSVSPLGRDITKMWQAVTQSLLCQDTPHGSLPPSGVTGTRGCTGTAVPGTIFPCWPMCPVATQEQELGCSNPGTTPVEGRAVPRARLAQEERQSCGAALHRCHPKATPVPVPIPRGCHGLRTGSTLRSVLWSPRWSQPSTRAQD